MRTFAAEEASSLAILGCDRLWSWRGDILLTRDGLRLHERGGPVEAPDGLAVHRLVRIDDSCTPLLEDGRTTELAGLLLAAVPADAPGLQLDWDVPTRLLPCYASFLRDLHRCLGTQRELWITALPTWLDDPGMRLVAEVVDGHVPQCYHLGPPAYPWRATSVTGAVDLAVVIAQSEALGRPWRLGLAAIETLVAYDADGNLLRAALPLAGEDLLADGAVVEAVQEGHERLWRLRLTRARLVEGQELPVGGTVLWGQPTAAGLRADLERLRAAGTRHCRGACLYRLDAPGTLPTLAPTRLMRARPAALAADLRRRDGRWWLGLHNPGDEDVTAFRAPHRVLLQGALVEAEGEGCWRAMPVSGGRPCSPARADGSLLELTFLRAGTTWELPLTTRAAAPVLRVLETGP